MIVFIVVVVVVAVTVVVVVAVVAVVDRHTGKEEHKINHKSHDFLRVGLNNLCFFFEVI